MPYVALVWTVRLRLNINTWCTILCKQNWNIRSVSAPSSPPYEIHKMITSLPQSKLKENKLKNWETDKPYLHLPHQAKGNNELRKFLMSCLDCSFSHFQCKFSKIWKLINLISHLSHDCWMRWVNSEIVIDTCLIIFTISQIPASSWWNE